MNAEDKLNQINSEFPDTSSDIPAIQSNQILDALMNANIYVFRYFPKQKMIVTSERIQKTFGLKATYTDMPTTFLEDCVCEEDRANVCELFQKINSNIPTATIQYRKRNGQVFFRITLTTVDWDKEGCPNVCAGIFEPIQEAKTLPQAKNTPRHDMSTINQLVESLLCGVFAYTLPERDIMILNSEARRLFGYETDSEQTLSEAMAKHIFPEDRAILHQAIVKLAEPGDRVDYQFRSRTSLDSDEYRIVHCYTKLMVFPDGHRYILSVLQDVTEREAQAARLKHLSIEQEKTAKLLEQERRHYRDALIYGCALNFYFDVTEGIIREPLVLSDGTDLVSKSGCELPIRYDEISAVLAENTSIQLMDENDRKYQTCEGLLQAFDEGRRTVELEYKITEADRYLNTTYFMFRERSDDHIYALALTRDLTTLRRKEAKQRRELRESLASEREKTAVIKGLSTIYYSIFHIMLDNDYMDIVNSSRNIQELLSVTSNAATALQLYINEFVSDKYKARISRFCDLSTLRDRMRDEVLISTEFQDSDNRWSRCSFIVLKKDAFLFTQEVLFVLEYIDEQKIKELEQQAALEEALKNAEQASIAKSNFLANMSHEIRTPMNAVLGMADLALREEMDPKASEYIHQIKNSGKNLLVIINDILDYSKIESGKMDIVEATYEPLSMLNDLSNVVNTRIGDRNVEFIMDIDPRLPYKLYGDNVRIQQIFINLLNNAVKFTRSGMVKLSISCRFETNDVVTLLVKVIDTGNGIKAEDMDKLFQSFQQIDSKRNRGVEGTGLGLAITSNLLKLMGGSISVESIYNQGSTFSFTLPQKIIQRFTPIEDASDTGCAYMLSNPYVKEQIITDLERVNAQCFDLDTGTPINELNPDITILDLEYFTDGIEDYFRNHTDQKCFLLVTYDSAEESPLPNVRILKKPVQSLQLYAAMGISDEYVRENVSENESFNFIAPAAQVLIVDDTEINLTVAKGLLEPLQMHVDTAISAAEAINMISKKQYDIIFMDHMMPEVDGIEATHIIRRLMPGYGNTPIIALTANVAGDAKDMFLREGMNDFVGKPIEINDITSKLRKWLPAHKLFLTEEKNSTDDTAPEIVIDGLDTKLALRSLGSADIYWSILKSYYKSIDKDTELIRSFLKAGQIKDYTIKVHSLKSCSRQIGALQLSEAAARLELAGHQGDMAYIEENTESMLELYQHYKEILAPYFPEEAPVNGTVTCSKEDLLAGFEKLSAALDELDMSAVDEIIGVMNDYQLDATSASLFHRLKDATEEFDVETSADILAEWKNYLT